MILICVCTMRDVWPNDEGSSETFEKSQEVAAHIAFQFTSKSLE